MNISRFEKQLCRSCAVVVLATGTVGELVAQIKPHPRAVSISTPLLPPVASITASAVDADGFIYLAGNLSTGDLATTPGAFEPSAPATFASSPPGSRSTATTVL